MRHHLHRLKRKNKGTRAHRNLCSPLKAPPSRPGSSTDYRADAKEVPLNITQKRRPGHYVLSCGCRTFKRSTSQRVAMLPARFLQPWKVLEKDIHNMGARLEAGNKHLLVVGGRARKLRFAYPPPNKTAENVAKKLLELLLTFGIPLSLRSYPGTEFTAEAVKHLCKWLNVTIDYGLTDHPAAQGAVERLGGWIHETLMELCKS